ncbi:AraC family transcriptional regulator [Pseudomaricurvus alkylphenolicus]|uniref:AraC family transcriptional regulator ligand-binding domain-containing protein n=1 Tax=Pseudomaricurvus alkylphenolicus TaxID=1306991 RepID=UPI00141F11D0|nr:AraC family transcriptional regulator [Pseudomaricurvus alkylphenolicus]
MNLPIRSASRSIQPKWLLDYFKAQQVDFVTLANVSGQDPATLVDSKGTMSLDAYLQLFTWAAEYFHEPHLGIQLANNASVDDFGVFGFLSSSAATFGDFCKLVERYQRILMQGEAFEFFRHPDMIEIRFCVDTGLVDCLTQDMEYTLATLVNLIKTYDHDQWYPVKTTFTHAAIEPFREYESVFGSDIFFSQPHNSIWIKSESWNLPLTTANPALLEVLTSQANHLLAEVESQQDFLSHVRLLISGQLGTEGFDSEALASQLHMTSRTLHRRLSQYGTSFKKLRMDLLLSVAREALIDSDASVADIAQRLGYSESSAFVRLFKRQEGLSPLQYRKTHQR